MYLLCHLAAGLIIGVILYWFFRDPVLIIAATIGGVTSDLIDKPIGHLLLKGTLDYGRIYAHGLVFFSLILICGILIWFRYRSLTGIAFSLGVLSHQLLDRMWDEPVNWLYPFRGPYIYHSINDYFGNAFFQEISNPSEWLFAASVMVILIFTLYLCRLRAFRKIYDIFIIFAVLLACICAISGLLLLYPGIESIGTLLTGLSRTIDIHLAGSVMLLTAFMTNLCIIRIH